MADIISDEQMAQMEAKARPAGFLSDADMATHEAQFKPSALESGLRGAAQGASLGFADEATGGLEALWDAAKGDPKTFGELYKQHRDESRANYQAAEQANPKTFMAGQLGGGAATLLVPGLGAAEGAGLGATLGKAALQGGLTGLGSSEATNAGGLAKDTAVGAGIGGALGGVGYGLGKGLSALQSGDAAENLAARAIGAERGTIKSLGADDVKEAGRYALDNGLLKGFPSTEEMASRNDALQSAAGKSMGDVYKTIDDAGASTFNPLNVATKVEDKIGDFWRSPINRGETNQLENTLESILMRGDQNIPLQEAQTLKQELGKVANWKNNLNISDKERMARDAYGVVSGAIDDATEQGAKTVGKDGLTDALSSAKELFGNSKTAETLLTNKLAREQGNKIFGLTDTIAGAGGFAGGGPVTAAATIAGKKALERYGTQAGALALNNISELLQKVPQAFGKYARVLTNAMQRGGTSLGATHYILQSSDPEYRKMLDNLQNK